MDKLLLQGKPISEMTREELNAGITQIRELREALAAETRKKNAEIIAAGLKPKAPRAPRAPKEPDMEVNSILAKLKAAAKAKK